MEEKNYINLDKSQVKKASPNKFVKFLRGMGIGILTFSAIAGTVAAKGLQTFKNELPSQAVIEQNMDSLNAKTEITGTDERFVFPEDGKVKVNVKIPKEKVTDEVKQGLFDAVSEINSMLSIVNQNYKLELNYEPKLTDKLYCFDVFDEKILDENICGTAQTIVQFPTINGIGKYNVKICLDLDKMKESSLSDSKNYENYIKNVSLHEIGGHGLGSLKDAYCLSNYNNSSIMDGLNGCETRHITKTDVKSIVSKYIQPGEIDGLDAKIDNYLKSTRAYSIMSEQANYIKTNFYEQVIEKNDEFISAKPEDFQFENIGNLCCSQTKDFYLQDENGINYNGQSGRFLKKTSGDKVEMLCVSGSPYKGLNYQISSFNVYDIDGMNVSENGMAYVKYKDSIIEVSVNKNKDGEKRLSCTGVYKQESNENYDKTKALVTDFCEKSKENNKYYLNVVSNSAKAYLKESGKQVVELKNIDNLEIVTRNSVYSFGKNQTMNLSNFDSNDNYKFELINGVIVSSSGEIVVSTSDGIEIYKSELDFKNGKVNLTKEDVLKSNYKVQQNNASKNVENETEREL